jgi:hypothetical protein
MKRRDLIKKLQAAGWKITEGGNHSMATHPKNLCGYVWPDEVGAEAMKKRRQTIRKALTELSGIGWRVAECAKGKWTIIRRYVSLDMY